MVIEIGKSSFFFCWSPFLLQRKDPLLYTVLLVPVSTTDTPPFVPEVVEYLRRVGGGFLVVERALSIAFAGNSISRSINGCWNAIWFFNARLLYPDGILQFQQDNFPAHTSKFFRDWFERRQDIELIDWPHCSPDVNPIANMWAQVKRHTCKNWPNLPPRRPDDL